MTAGSIGGVWEQKIRSIPESLAGRFASANRVIYRPGPNDDRVPGVSELLDIDAEYRLKAEADRLLRVAPLRFNPTGRAWLPILQTHRVDRHYTAIFTNTAKAHELGATHDWVVIIRDDHERHGKWTVITSRFGKLKVQWIVRGREDECDEYYQTRSQGRNSLFG